MPVVKPSEIEHLVFSGGGARALAFLGAVAELEERLRVSSLVTKGERRTGIRAFAGSSAGALLAMGLAVGYSSDQLAAKLRRYTREDIQKSFKQPRLYHVPALVTHDLGTHNRMRRPFVSGPRTRWSLPRRDHSALQSFRKDLHIKATLDDKGLSPAIELIGDLTGGIGSAASVVGTATRRPFLALIGAELQNLSKLTNSRGWVEGIREKLYKVALEKAEERDQRYRVAHKRRWPGVPPPDLRWIFNPDWFRDLAFNLAVHGGLLAGYGLRNLAAALLKDAPALSDVSSPIDLTFGQLREKLGSRLVVMGSKLDSGKSKAFSDHYTPDFPIYQAIAISMSFPLAYKPTRIIKGAAVPDDYIGDWTDGGLLNNFALDAFGPTEFSPASHRTLGFYLRDTPNNSTAVSLDEMLRLQATRVANAALSHAGAGKLSEAEELQTVEVDSKKLTTLDMMPHQEWVRSAVRSARRSTERMLDDRSCPRRLARISFPPNHFEAVARIQLGYAYKYVSIGEIRVAIGSGNSETAARFDILVADDEDGPIYVYEAKSTGRAPITRSQRDAITALASKSGRINPTRRAFDGEDGEQGPFKKRKIAKQVVRILRPETLCAEVQAVHLAKSHGGSFPQLPKQTEKARGPGWPKEVG